MLYIANFRSQWVTVYAPDDGRRVASIHVGDGPSALALSSNRLFLFVVDTRSGDISIARTDTRKLVAMLPAGRAPQRHRRQILQTPLKTPQRVPEASTVSPSGKPLADEASYCPFLWLLSDYLTNNKPANINSYQN